MRRAGKVVLFIAECLLALFLGNALFHVIDRLPFDMPYPVERVVKGLLRALGHDDLTDPDDMETIVGLAVAVITTAVAAVVIWVVHVAVRRRIGRLSQI